MINTEWKSFEQVMEALELTKKILELPLSELSRLYENQPEGKIKNILHDGIVAKLSKYKKTPM